MKLLLLLVLIGLSLHASSAGTPKNPDYVKWVKFTGSVPFGAVGFDNRYSKHYEYVCQAECSVGYYRPSVDKACHVGYNGFAVPYPSFYLLVNGGVRNLQWFGESEGSVPSEAIKSRCSGIYVGKNEYGLGKVDKPNKKFYQASGVKEKSYGNYDVLAFAAPPKPVMWVPFTGSMPQRAVSWYNKYERVTDFVCRSIISAGFYRPSKGPYCYTTYGGGAYKMRNFDVLVSEIPSKYMKWARGPIQNAVSASSGVYVARNSETLGKFDSKTGAFYFVSRYWKREAQVWKGWSLLTFEDPTKSLQWVKWTGSVPEYAVRIKNHYLNRIDYICRYNFKHMTGFYRPKQDPYCHVSYSGKEFKFPTFDLLLNKQNFAILKWKHGSTRKLPAHSIGIGHDVYVGMNKYGLGKVNKKYFYLPWKGKEYKYKDYYALTYEYQRWLISQHITGVKYSKNHEKLQTSSAAEILQSSSVSNTKCKKVKKTVKLSKEVLSDKRWDVSGAITEYAPCLITAKVPEVSSATLKFTGGETKYLSVDSTTYYKTHSVTAAVEVPPNHSCAVHMTGKRYELTIPFTAKVMDKYTKNKVLQTDVTGTFKGEGFTDFKAVVDACKPIPNAGACHK